MVLHAQLRSSTSVPQVDLTEAQTPRPHLTLTLWAGGVQMLPVQGRAPTCYLDRTASTCFFTWTSRVVGLLWMFREDEEILFKVFHESSDYSLSCVVLFHVRQERGAPAPHYDEPVTGDDDDVLTGNQVLMAACL